MVTNSMRSGRLEFHLPRQALLCLVLFGVAAFIAILHVDFATQQSFFPLKILQSHLINNVRGGMLRGALNQTEMPLSTDSGLEVAEKNGTKEKKSKSPGIAICVVGEARKFELTGPSLLKYVLNMYNNSDVFLHAPFNRDSHKFSLLKDACSVAAVRIFTPERIVETALLKNVFPSTGSRSGLQVFMKSYHDAKCSTDQVGLDPLT